VYKNIAIVNEKLNRKDIMMTKFFDKLFTAQTVFILSLINLGLAIFTANIPAICGWLVATLGAVELMMLGK
jgi:hypothetical protein